MVRVANHTARRGCARLIGAASRQAESERTRISAKLSPPRYQAHVDDAQRIARAYNGEKIHSAHAGDQRDEAHPPSSPVLISVGRPNDPHERLFITPAPDRQPSAAWQSCSTSANGMPRARR